MQNPASMEEVSSLSLSPSRTKSKRTRTSLSKDGHRERLQKKPSSGPTLSSSSTPHSATRPSLTSRTASAPLVPSLRDHKLEILGFESDGHNHRDSIASIKDDPFFRNYQSPQSVSLARELRSATHTEKLRDEGSRPPAQTAGRIMDDSVNIPVCDTQYPKKLRTSRMHKADTFHVWIAPIEEWNGRYQHCGYWKCWRREEHAHPTRIWQEIAADINSHEYSNVGGPYRIYRKPD